MLTKRVGGAVWSFTRLLSVTVVLSAGYGDLGDVRLFVEAGAEQLKQPPTKEEVLRLTESWSSPGKKLHPSVLDSLLDGPKIKPKIKTRAEAYSSLTFFCSRCRRMIAPPMGKEHPSVVEDWVRGIVRVEEARQRHMEGHYRHRHTDYEPQMRNLERKYGGGQQPYSNEAFWTEADPIRERCNANARRLMVEDGLLAEDGAMARRNSFANASAT